jgi:hypothetical protein
VTKADPVWESRRHNSDVAAQATAGESVHAASPLRSSGRNGYNEQHCYYNCPFADAHKVNLFLRNKKGVMWLVTCLEDRRIDLKDLGGRLGAGRLSFGSAERLMHYLGVLPGAVTPFAVVNDHGCAVTVALDHALLDLDPVNCHPLTNTRTTAIAARDLVRFLEAEGHPPQIVEFAAE